MVMYSVWAQVLAYGRLRDSRLVKPEGPAAQRLSGVSLDEAKDYIRRQIDLLKGAGYMASGDLDAGFLLRNDEGGTLRVYVMKDAAA